MKKGLLFGATISLLIFVGLRRNSAPFFSIKEYRCVQDEFLSDEYFSFFNSALTDLINDNSSAETLIVQLKEQFSVLKTIVVAYRPCMTHVMISVHEPVCCINNSLVLTAHHELFPKNVFSASVIADIPNVAVFQDSMTNAPLFVSSLLQGLPCGINCTYKLELVNEHCVHFVDKEQPNFTIVSSIAQEKSPMLLSQCESVKQIINARKGFDKGAKWIADTRFVHYIVAYKA